MFHRDGLHRGLHRGPQARSRRGSWIGLAALLVLGGCARGPALPDWVRLGARAEAEPRAYFFFDRVRSNDPWRLTIDGWQLRQGAARRAGLIAPFPTPPAPLPAVSSPKLAQAPGLTPDAEALAHRYDAFLAAERRDLARDVLDWIQGLAATRFVEDGPRDHWPTLVEVLYSRGDDCDGLELLTYHALRQLGFEEDRVYRAVLHEPETGRHHMVTLWFESPSDPWVLDPTATITSRLAPLSALPAWVPVRVFSERSEYRVTALEPRPQGPEASPGPGPQE